MSQAQKSSEHLEEEQKRWSQFITFTVKGLEYGIDIMSIREIKGWSETTTLPNAPHYMRGVINLRGTVVPILDLRARLNMGETETTKNHVVMIVHIGTRLVGILVDGVSDILTVEHGQIRPVPDMDGSQKDGVLKGLVSLDNRMVGLLITEKLLDAGASFEMDFASLEDMQSYEESTSSSRAAI